VFPRETVTIEGETRDCAGRFFGFVAKFQNVTIDFKGCHYPKDVILYVVFFYIRYAVSYRDLEEIMAERGVEVDYATLNR
jgi:hypothetical protein